MDAGDDRAADQLLQVSKIINRKYRFIQASLFVFAASLILGLGSVLSDHYFADVLAHHPGQTATRTAALTEAVYRPTRRTRRART